MRLHTSWILITLDLSFDRNSCTTAMLKIRLTLWRSCSATSSESVLRPCIRSSAAMV